MDKSDLIDGTDYIQGLAGEDYALYWLRDDLNLREFKLAIGAKYVWKHRMRFYNSIEEMKPETEDVMSDSEIVLMEKIKKQILKK